MSLQNKIAEAKRMVGKNKTLILYVTDKGRIRNSSPEKWEGLAATIYAKEKKIVVDFPKTYTKKK